MIRHASPYLSPATPPNGARLPVAARLLPALLPSGARSAFAELGTRRAPCGCRPQEGG